MSDSRDSRGHSNHERKQAKRSRLNRAERESLRRNYARYRNLLGFDPDASNERGDDGSDFDDIIPNPADVTGSGGTTPHSGAGAKQRFPSTAEAEDHNGSCSPSILSPTTGTVASLSMPMLDTADAGEDDAGRLRAGDHLVEDEGEMTLIFRRKTYQMNLTDFEGLKMPVGPNVTPTEEENYRRVVFSALITEETEEADELFNEAVSHEHFKSTIVRYTLAGKQFEVQIVWKWLGAVTGGSEGSTSTNNVPHLWLSLASYTQRKQQLSVKIRCAKSSPVRCPAPSGPLIQAFREDQTDLQQSSAVFWCRIDLLTRLAVHQGVEMTFVCWSHSDDAIGYQPVLFHNKVAYAQATVEAQWFFQVDLPYRSDGATKSAKVHPDTERIFWLYEPLRPSDQLVRQRQSLSTLQSTTDPIIAIDSGTSRVKDDAFSCSAFKDEAMTEPSTDLYPKVIAIHTFVPTPFTCQDFARDSSLMKKILDKAQRHCTVDHRRLDDGSYVHLCDDATRDACRLVLTNGSSDENRTAIATRTVFRQVQRKNEYVQISSELLGVTRVAVECCLTESFVRAQLEGRWGIAMPKTVRRNIDLLRLAFLKDVDLRVLPEPADRATLKLQSIAIKAKGVLGLKQNAIRLSMDPKFTEDTVQRFLHFPTQLHRDAIHASMCETFGFSLRHQSRFGQLSLTQSSVNRERGQLLSASNSDSCLMLRVEEESTPSVQSPDNGGGAGARAQPTVLSSSTKQSKVKSTGAARYLPSTVLHYAVSMIVNGQLCGENLDEARQSFEALANECNTILSQVNQEALDAANTVALLKALAAEEESRRAGMGMLTRSSSTLVDSWEDLIEKEPTALSAAPSPKPEDSRSDDDAEHMTSAEAFAALRALDNPLASKLPEEWHRLWTSAATDASDLTQRVIMLTTLKDRALPIEDSAKATLARLASQ